MMGRPTKLTTDCCQRITSAIRTGATYVLACHYGGISYQTFLNWMERGRIELERRENPRVTTEKDQEFVDFFEGVKKAEGDAAVGWLAKIEMAANDGNWQAAAWKLERRYPSDYGRRVVDANVTATLTWGDVLTEAHSETGIYDGADETDDYEGG